MTQPIVVSDASTRPEIEAAIAALRAKAKRLPGAWRVEVDEEVDRLVDRWIAAKP